MVIMAAASLCIVRIYVHVRIYGDLLVRRKKQDLAHLHKLPSEIDYPYLLSKIDLFKWNLQVPKKTFTSGHTLTFISSSQASTSRQDRREAI